MLGRNYRFTLLNSCGQTLAQNSVTVQARRWKWGPAGARLDETDEAQAYIMDAAAGLATANYDSDSAIDNSTTKWVGGDFELTVTAPASASGDVILYYEQSTDGGTTFATNGLGREVCRINFAAAGTKVRHFSL